MFRTLLSAAPLDPLAGREAVLAGLERGGVGADAREEVGEADRLRARRPRARSTARAWSPGSTSGGESAITRAAHAGPLEQLVARHDLGHEADLAAPARPTSARGRRAATAA